jgi:type II secretory ATPase GspE/PulE/Tfp pilus assembly ATPase PilB-like protein
MDLLQQFVAFFEKSTGKSISHAQYHIVKAILATNEGLMLFSGTGRGLGKTTLLTALEAFAHMEERKIGGSAEVKK